MTSQHSGTKRSVITATIALIASLKGRLDEQQNSCMKGIVITAVIASIAPFVVYGVTAFVFYPVAGKLLAWITFFASLLYFGRKGFHNIPAGPKGKELFFGKPTGKIFPQGWMWTWPEPIGGISFPKPKSKEVPHDDTTNNQAAAHQASPATPVVASQTTTAVPVAPAPAPASSQPAAAATPPTASPAQSTHQGQRRRNRPNKP